MVLQILIQREKIKKKGGGGRRRKNYSMEMNNDYLE